MTLPAALLSVIKLRRIAVEEARTALAHRLAAEIEAESDVRAATDAIARQTAAASDLAADDLTVEALGAWLPKGRAERGRAEAALASATAETTRARATLSAARGAHEAAGALRDRLIEEARAAEARAEQHALDDAARGCRPADMEPGDALC